MKAIRNILFKIYGAINYVGMAALFFGVMVVIVDIILKYTLKTRILGNDELVSITMVLTVFLGMGLTQLEKGHVRVTMFVEMMPKRLEKLVEVIMTVATIIVVFLLVRAGIQYAASMAVSGTGTSVLGIPITPFAYIMGFGMALLLIAFVVDCIESLIELVKGPKVEEVAE